MTEDSHINANKDLRRKFPPHTMLAHVLVSHADISMLLLKQLTALEAGRLGGACRAARVLVRRAEADEKRFIEELRFRRHDDNCLEMAIAFEPPMSDEDFLELHRETHRWAEKHRVFLPMWNTEHVLARLERYRQPFFAAGGLQWRETTALVCLLVNELQADGIINLQFDLELARNAQKPSLLGCHELRVRPFCTGPWAERLRNWAMVDGSCFSDGMDDDLVMRQSRRRHPGSYMLDLLRDLGLKPSGALFMPAQLPVDWPPELLDCRQLCHGSWVPAYV